MLKEYINKIVLENESTIEMKMQLELQVAGIFYAQKMKADADRLKMKKIKNMSLRRKPDCNMS
jgi:hypothetical protein